jgi:hypothetical protein
MFTDDLTVSMEILLTKAARRKFTPSADTIVGLLLHKSRVFGFPFSGLTNIKPLDFSI